MNRLTREGFDTTPAALVRHAATAVLCGLLVALPLAFGGVLPWTHELLRVVVFVLIMAVLPAAGRWRPTAALSVPAGAVAAVALLGLLQSFSWPPPVASFISPAHGELFAAAGGAGVPLSLAPELSAAMALTWLAAAACLVLGAVLAADSTHRRWLLVAVVGSALLQLVYGARHWMTGSTRIWGVETATDSDRLRGTFVNADHFAMYLEIVLAVVLAWAWWAWRRRRMIRRPEERVLLLAPPILLWLVLFAGLSFSGSRAALIAVAAATAAQGLAMAARDRQWRRGSVALLAPLVGVLLVTILGVQAGFGRWLGTSQTELSENGRLEVYRASFELWQRFPATGTGLASFRDAFTLVQPVDLRGGWWHAHNDLLELLVTTGVLGAAIILAALVYTLVRLVRAGRLAQRSHHGAVALAAFGALVAVLTHSCFDFGLTMPANSITLAVLCGAALSDRMTAASR